MRFLFLLTIISSLVVVVRSPAATIRMEARSSNFAESGWDDDDDIDDESRKLQTVYKLPVPQTSGGGMSLTEALMKRRTVYNIKNQPLTMSEISQLLWSAQGITKKGGYRTSPSAGALYPLEIYVLTRDGHYHYDPNGHTITTLGNVDIRESLYKATYKQHPVDSAPAVIVVTAVYERTALKYGLGRTPRYVAMEAGHACENLLLQVTALGLGGVSIGAFDDDSVQDVLNIPKDHKPLYVIPVGPLA